jgi:hypothetical protein
MQRSVVSARPSELTLVQWDEPLKRHQNRRTVRAGPAPGYDGVGGHEEAVLHLYRADGVQVAIQVQDDVVQPGRRVPVW